MSTVHVHTIHAVFGQGGLADMCSKVLGGGLHEGGGSTIYSFIFERGRLKGNFVQRHGAAYTSQYGSL